MKKLLLPGAFAAISLVIALAWGQQPSLAVGGPPFGRTAITPATLTVHPSLLGPQVNPSAVLGAAITTQFNFARAPIPSPMASAGLKNSSFPGGEMADRYHYATNTTGACNPNGINPSPVPAANFDYWMQHIVQPNSMTPAVQVNYGSNAACSGGGDPTEAAAWVTYANTSANNSGAPYNIVWWVIGRGQYAAAQSGTYNTDLHPPLNGQSCPGNPVCYVNYEAAFYNDMHAAATATGIPINVCLDAAPQFPNTNWDLTVLKQALYDCVAVNFYPENTNQTGCNTAISDSYLVKQAANCFTGTFLTQLLNRLGAAGRAGTPIYVSEIGSVESSPGPQSESITSSLYAGQMIGEMLNDGINLGTWNNAYSACNPGPFTPPTPYSWQDYGSLAMFSAHDPNCDQTSALGTLQANANAYLNASHFVRAGETMLGLDVSGNQSINAYATTYNGSYAVMIFNTHPKNTITTTVAIDGITSGGGGDIYTYGKAEYDNSQNEVWSPPTHTTLGSWSTNFSLSLAPWSMTVVVLNGGVSPTPTPAPGALAATPAPLPAFTAFTQSQTESVSQSNYTGQFNYSGCTNGVATLSKSSGQGPSDTFNVIAQANGSCTVTVQGYLGATVPVGVSVSTPTPGMTPTPTPGPITATPKPVPTFTAFSQQQLEQVEQDNYIGTFGESDTCTGIASISTLSGPGPIATFNVTANANGTCNITITGYSGSTVGIPVTVATPTPSAGVYSYQGCQVYGEAPGTADNIVNHDISAAAIDSHSGAIISNLTGKAGFGYSPTAALEIVNIAHNSTPSWLVVTSNHIPPITIGYAGGGMNAQVQWQGTPPGQFKFEGSFLNNCPGDCHWVVLNVDTCYVEQGNPGSWVNPPTNKFTTGNGIIDNLHVDYTTQWTSCGTATCQHTPGANKFDNVTVAGIPLLGFTDYGEDLLLPSINHPIGLDLPRQVTYNGNNPGFGFSPAGPGNAGGSCGISTGTCLTMGDIIRLKSSVTCPADPVAAVVCNQLKHYGAVATDTQGGTTTYGFFFGLTVNGTDNTTSAMRSFVSGLSITNFDVISRTLLVP